MNETEDLIRRKDVIQALVDCYDMTGNAHMSLMKAIEKIPAVESEEPSPIKNKTAFLVSTKAELITDKVNEWIEANPDAIIWNIVPFMSYTTIKEKGAMMIGCMIEYTPRDKNS